VGTIGKRLLVRDRYKREHVEICGDFLYLCLWYLGFTDCQYNIASEAFSTQTAQWNE